jgi:REP-associated tyrosine transposase
MLEFQERRFQMLVGDTRRGHAVKPYPLAEDLLQPVLRVAMPRAPRLVVPGSTVHVVARCNNREFYFTSAEDFELLLAHLRELVRTFEVKVCAYTLMSNHVHLLMETPIHEAPGRPLRWFMTETAKAFHKARGRRGHFWERRYRLVMVEDDLYALAALRYLDRNPVRAGLVEDPTTCPWSSCAAYARGDANPLITLKKGVRYLFAALTGTSPEGSEKHEGIAHGC